MHGDLAADGECQRVVNEAADKLQGLTTLVNSAGVLFGGAFGAPNTDMDQLMSNFRTNTFAVFETMTHATPFLRNSADANPSIVNVSSGGHRSLGTHSRV